MKQLFLFALAAFPLFVFANVEKVGRFDVYQINIASETPVTVQFTTVVETKDSCNDFGLAGTLRLVELPVGTQSLQQDFVADFNIISTEKGCPPSNTIRKIPLESDEFEIKPILGTIYARFFVPENMVVEIVSK